MSAPRIPVSERLFQRVTFKENGCWESLRPRTGNMGYAKISDDDRRTTTVHRVSWLVHNGPIPSGMLVCHKCDNPPCFRPDHLFLGTQLENIRDCVDKGRNSKRYRHRGERTPNSILTDSDVIDIRTLSAFGARNVDLAREFGIDPSVISNVISRKTWKHVP